MMNNRAKTNRTMRNIKRTIKNKLCAIALLMVGLVPLMVYQDGTFLAFAAVIGLPLFFAKDNWID